MLCVIAYGYLIQYQNSSIDQEASELMISLKSLDAAKLDTVKKYRATFSKALENSQIIELIKNKGIESQSVAQKIVDIFEKDSSLPVLGVRLLDENGNGAFVKGNDTSNINV